MFIIKSNLRFVSSALKTCGIMETRAIRHCSLMQRDNATSRPAPVSHPDILLKSLKFASDTADVLQYIQVHSKIMNCSHLMQAFRTIFSLQKFTDTGMSNGEVIKNPSFSVLCNVLKSQSRSLELRDTIDALKILSFLGIPASSKIISILLQLITKQVNDLSLQEIIFLDFLVKDFKPTPLVEALRIALPLVFAANLSLKLESDNINQLSALMRYASNKNIPQSSVDLIIDNLMRERHKIGLEEAMTVVRSLCNLKRVDESHRPLLHHSLDVLTDAVEKISFSKLDSILNSLASRYSQHNYFFYHEEFFKAASDYVVINDCGFEEGVWLLKKLNKVNHVNMQLLDYLASKVDKEPWILESARVSIFFSFVQGFAIADYRPKAWLRMEPLILKNISNFLPNLELPWVPLARHLCVLGTWPLDLISHIFTAQFLQKYLSRKYNLLDFLQVGSLYQEVSSLCPSYSGPLPPSEVLEEAKWIKSQNKNSSPLKSVLEKGFGKNYILNNIWTKFGHEIDHCIVLRKGGFPVAFNNADSLKNVADLEVHPDHQIVAVMYLQPSFYCINLNKLKGTARLNIDALESSGITVIPVSASSWEMILEHEKAPYLMRLITEKCSITKDSEF